MQPAPFAFAGCHFANFDAVTSGACLFAFDCASHDFVRKNCHFVHAPYASGHNNCDLARATSIFSRAI